MHCQMQQVDGSFRAYEHGCSFELDFINWEMWYGMEPY